MPMIPIPAPKLVISYNEPPGGRDYYIQLVEWPSGLLGILEWGKDMEFCQDEGKGPDWSRWSTRLAKALEDYPTMKRFV